MGQEKSESPTVFEPMNSKIPADSSSYRMRVTYEASKLAQLTKSLSVRQWLEHSTGLWEVMGSNPVRDSDFIFVPCPWQDFISI